MSVILATYPVTYSTIIFLISFNLVTKVMIIKVLTSNELNPKRVIFTVLMRAREKVVFYIDSWGEPLSPFPSFG